MRGEGRSHSDTFRPFRWINSRLYHKLRHKNSVPGEEQCHTKPFCIILFHYFTGIGCFVILVKCRLKISWDNWSVYWQVVPDIFPVWCCTFKLNRFLIKKNSWVRTWFYSSAVGWMEVDLNASLKLNLRRGKDLWLGKSSIRHQRFS